MPKISNLLSIVLGKKQRPKALMFLFAIMFSAVGCVHDVTEVKGDRFPASVNNTPPQYSLSLVSSRLARKSREPQSSDDFLDGISIIKDELGDEKIFNPKTCSSYIASIKDPVFERDSSYFVPENQEQIKRMRQEGLSKIKDLYLLRLKLREKLESFDRSGELQSECVVSIRKSMQYLRFAEEFLFEWLQVQGVVSVETPEILSKSFPHTVITPGFENFELQSGDVLMVRGKAVVSAMIARIGDAEAQFSHAALIGVDEKGKKYVIESLIQYGTIVTPLEEWLKGIESRVVLYRFKDQNMALKAGQLAYQKASFNIKKLGKTIPYDFSMDDKNHESLFCAELIQWAYELASDGKVHLPWRKTTASKFKDTGYLKSLGIGQEDLFSPADLEVDYQFQMIAEYRHWPLLRQVRMQDAVLSSIYTWMIEKDYRFDYDPFIESKASIAKIMRRFGFFKDQLPTNMPYGTVLTTLKFQAIAEMLEKNIYKTESFYFLKNGHSLTYKELLEINEKYRIEDCEKHRSYMENSKRLLDILAFDRSDFHYMFNVEKGTCQK